MVPNVADRASGKLEMFAQSPQEQAPTSARSQRPPQGLIEPVWAPNR